MNTPPPPDEPAAPDEPADPSDSAAPEEPADPDEPEEPAGAALPAGDPTPRRRGMPGPARSGWRAALTRRRVVTGLAVVAAVAALVVWIRWPEGESVRSTAATLTVHDAGEIRLDTTIYVPSSATAKHPVPAVMLAHGFGGSKNSVASDARTLASKGYVVLTWSARGFGRSGGKIGLDGAGEVADASALIDVLAKRSDVRQDARNDPRVGVVGASYGGALALLLAERDQRVDAIVPQYTWNNLANVFFPEASGKGATGGVFKKAWAGLFFSSAGAGGDASDLAALVGADATGSGTSDLTKLTQDQINQLVQCGRFEATVCRYYLQAASTGKLTNDSLAMLLRSSPANELAKIKAPTLLIQGQADTLFPLSEADANYRGIAAAGTPVSVVWSAGGHDSTTSTSEDDRVQGLTVNWLDHYLRGRGPTPSSGFSYTTAGAISVRDTRPITRVYTLDTYPGLAASEVGTRYPVRLDGINPQPVSNPPNGTPGAISSLPGFAALTSQIGNAGVDVPGQFASYTGGPFARALDVVGSPRVRLRVAAPAGTAVLFVKLYDVDADGSATLPGGAVAPIRLTGLPRTAAELAKAPLVEIELPAVGHRIEAGHSVRLVVATSDQAYAGLAEPAVYQVSVSPSSLTLPVLSPEPVADATSRWLWALLGLVILVLLGAAVAVGVVRWRGRRRDVAVDQDAAGSPLVVRGLRKAYDDGYLAVRDLSFTVEPGQVVGLLGPNGAGKTTALRMLLGLIRPTEGEILVFGHRIAPGAPVLSRIGAFVEGPGLLPHLSGLANLRQFWQATGRPLAAARLDEALEIAGLGDAVHRKVKTYSQGMRQRMAIAQAMLGLPDLLVLDEPTNGLDPPQIAEMRAVLSRYATDGRAVLVSSHLLAEVEQVCTHVVVMSRGSGVAAGTVGEIVGEGRSVLIEVTDGDRAAAVTALESMPGVALVDPNGHGVVVELAGANRGDVVRALVSAGVGVERLMPRRRLEDVFLELVEEGR